MCGIAGLIAPNAARYAPALGRMMDRLVHRGPDGEGRHFFQGCGLGHRRLKIIDLVSGDQPMLDSAGRRGLVFNGEIYGYQELRRGIRDYPFHTQSDTEVILALYDRLGTAMADRLPGMFAFGLWDDQLQQLFCMRDRFGEKPFYYAVGPQGEFLFASEIKALLASGLVEPALDEASLTHYLQDLYVPPDRTIYTNIFVLPPAHALLWKDGQVRLWRYWDFPAQDPGLRPQQAVEKFRYLLDRAVARQLVADVPVGAFLSGGLDSSTLVALAVRHTTRLKTFAFGFGDSINELPLAREVAGKFGTEHVELEDRQEDIAALLLKMQEVYDEPFADSSNIPTYLLSQRCRPHVSVVLSGDGGDELLAGYTFWYRQLYERERAARLPGLIRGMLSTALMLGRKWNVRRPSSLDPLERGLDLAGRFRSCGAAHRSNGAFFSVREIQGLGWPKVRDLKASLDAASNLEEVIRWDTRNYLPGDILTKTDRASMAHSLELRAPFLDHEFASFCLSLPTGLKITAREDKKILREAFAGDWPPAVRSRGKQGFGAPVRDWLKQDSVKELREEYLGNPCRKIFHIFDYQAVQSLRTQTDYRAWILLNLALWMESHPCLLPGSGERNLCTQV